MSIEKQFSNCKNWDTDLCPHQNHEAMKKTIPSWPLNYLGTKEYEAADSLCEECLYFTPNKVKD